MLICILLFGCDSKRPSSLLIGSWSCEYDDSDMIAIFHKNGRYSIAGFSLEWITEMRCSYKILGESENDMVIDIINNNSSSHDRIRLTITFKNKDLIDTTETKRNESFLMTCGRYYKK